MPRARSSGALSMSPKLFTFAWPFIARTFVIAAVSVVLPWSTCPIVPTFTCGLLRSNFSLFMAKVSGSECICCFERRLVLNDRVGDVRRHFQVLFEFHRKRGATLAHGAHGRRVP